MTAAPEASRRIEYVSLKKLRADPRNPKAHAAEAIEHSVGRFGFVEPIVVDERTGFIVSGHGRVETLTRLRVDRKPAPEGVRVTSKGDWQVPVVHGWASSSNAEAGAALIALNRTGELGGWVDEALLDLLQEIDDADDLGFDARTVADLESALTAIAATNDDDWLAAVEKVPQEGEEQSAYTRTFTIRPDDIKVVDEAIEAAQDLVDGGKTGAALALIMREWLTPDV